MLDRGYAVTVLDDMSGGFAENVPAAARLVQGSVLDTALLEDLCTQHSYTAIYHLAAYAAEGLSHFIRSFNYQHNLIGSVNLINAAVRHRVRRFVFTYSIAVYGAGQVPMLESTAPQPEDPYGISKYAVELDLKSAHEMFGLAYTIFRPHNVYGELQNIGDRYRNVIGIFMNQIMANQPLTIFGNGEQKRAFSYVDDVARPMVDCLDLPDTCQQIFNIGADQPYSVNELAQAVMHAMGQQVPIQHLEARNEVLDAYWDQSKIAKFFPNLRPPTSLPDGLARMAAWAKKVGARQTRLFMDVELWDRLPASWEAEFSQKR